METSGYFPPWAPGDTRAGIVDDVYDDFERQAERLTGHDQSYIQLTPGAYSGRFLSCAFGPFVSVHFEQANQALEQEVTCGPDVICIGCVLSPGEPYRANGTVLDRTGVVVLPPGSTLHLVSPRRGGMLAFVLDAGRFLLHPGTSPEARDWLARLGRSVGFLGSPGLAGRLREDAREALEALRRDPALPGPDADALGQALLAGVAGKLSLTVHGLRRGGAGIPPAFRRFMETRRLLRVADPVEPPALLVDPDQPGSLRSLQRAFSAELDISPMAYFRILRLHEARRTLLSAEGAALSIGDVAARNGYWDWSRFSKVYKRHFGEAPSETRRRLAGMPR